ncbi:MAG: shikimate kinase [Myxococcota bacterium]|nr:shikimate kinase [Myxococcota bacterium]
MKASAISNIALSGPPGSGKSAVGRALSELMNKAFVDMDEVLTQQFGCSIDAFFATQGEAAFREAEAALVRDLCQRRDLVIATGGGVLLRKGNRDALEASAIIVNLSASAEVLKMRLKGTSDRPLLKGDLAANLDALLKRRQAIYDAVKNQVNTDDMTPDQIAALIARIAAKQGIGISQ